MCVCVCACVCVCVCVCVFKQDLALHNLKCLTCHKIQSNQTFAQSAGAVEYTDYIFAGV